VGRIAEQNGCTPAQVLLRWAVQRDVVVIPKSLREARIRENARIFDFELSVADMGALDGLDETGGTGDAL
jgi:diketogulonate reductase-like aldo/keto reductase